MDWQKIKKEYETSDITLKALAEKHGVKLGTLKSRKSREKWTRGATKKDATNRIRDATEKKEVATQKEYKVDAPELTEKQQRFVEQYVIDLNATQAAIRAGYSERSAYSIGQENLKKPEVLARVKEIREQQKQDSYMDALWVLERLAQVTDRSMTTEPVMMWDHAAQELVETGEYQYDSQGANKALELIGKHLGMFDPKAKHIDAMSQAQIEKVKAETAKIKAETKNEEEGTSRIVIVNDKEAMRKEMMQRDDSNSE
ncbi:Terminase small subunit [Salipaludibacillus aurantiacus]|uniref:Terminase small subunit n=2 Tax=Salipaludibacillus aurantiacus TaxID=1601833 RepID=A0A1H9U0V6_9BACI|nr:Terminase small subunit [Salipaludibacillus aurantiacus]